MDNFAKLLDMINIGLLVMDRNLKVRYWNRWMELHSDIASENIVGSHIFDFFPNLNNPRFLRNCKSVIKFGNFCFFSQKLHGYLFPFKSTDYYDSGFEYMQQNCTMGPLRDENNSIQFIFISVEDVTDVASYEKRLMELNIKDGLTGLYNRRFLEQKLKEEMGRYKRYSRPFSIIMLDIDHFKRINDTYGHQCGDKVLQSIASTVLSHIRKTDFLARYGGEEFCCVLPETRIEQALILAERLRKAVSKIKIKYKVKMTVSLGVAEARKGIDTPELLLKKADDALYRAKESGRNRVMAMDVEGVKDAV